MRVEMISRSNLEVDAIVKGPPDEEALDEAAAGQPVFVHVNPVQAAVSLVVDPPLVLVQVTCRTVMMMSHMHLFHHWKRKCFMMYGGSDLKPAMLPGQGSPSMRYATLS